MQKSNEHTVESIFLAVPVDLLEEVGIDEFSTVQMHTSQGQLILEPVDEEVDGLYQVGHDSLEDFLESLTPRKQFEAMSFLSALWAEREEVNEMHYMGGRE